MVQHSLGDTGKYLNEEWHKVRRIARTETYSINEWGEIDITRYDLDTVDFDRKQKDSAFHSDPRMESEGTPESGFDKRVLPVFE